MLVLPCWYNGKKKSTQRCEGVNPKTIVRRHQNEPMFCIFLKQHDRSKYVILNKELHLKKL